MGHAHESGLLLLVLLLVIVLDSPSKTEHDHEQEHEQDGAIMNVNVAHTPRSGLLAREGSER